MTAVTTDRLIAPHGGTLVDRTGDAPEDPGSLEVVMLTSRELSDLDMIASGALSPLEGFMAKADYQNVVEEMHLANGLPWALPVCLAVDSAPAGDRVALADEAGHPVAVLEVEETYEYDKEREAEHCFRTTDDAHPGVARLYAQKPLYLAGRVTVFERAAAEFPELARDPSETRRIFAERGWRRVVGFQTRNPIHRAHAVVVVEAVDLRLEFLEERRRELVHRRVLDRDDGDKAVLLGRDVLGHGARPESTKTRIPVAQRSLKPPASRSLRLMLPP